MARRQSTNTKSTIDLSPAPRQIGEWVFLELADLYATLDRPCDAAQTIMNWVAIDPGTRNTARAHKLVETYAARGCAVAPSGIRARFSTKQRAQTFLTARFGM